MSKDAHATSKIEHRGCSLMGAGFLIRLFLLGCGTGALAGRYHAAVSVRGDSNDGLDNPPSSHRV